MEMINTRKNPLGLTMNHVNVIIAWYALEPWFQELVFKITIW